MAEIGIVASVIAVVGVGARLSIIAFDFAASVGKAGHELQTVAREISALCSVLQQLQTVLENAHFRPSKTAVEEIGKITLQCRQVFDEIEDTLKNLKGFRGDVVFPAPSVDFVSKVKWTFGKKSKVLVLRSTLDACKSTLSVMLMTMLLADRVAQRLPSAEEDTLAQTEEENAMTQSLIIAQQCALEQLEHCEDDAEKEDEFDLQLPEHADASSRTTNRTRRKSRGRLFHMFSGLSINTSIPNSSTNSKNFRERKERASSWLEHIVALPEEEETGQHPGKPRQKRISSAGTANASSELLRKWTDQTKRASSKDEARTQAIPNRAQGPVWTDSNFSFPDPEDSQAEASRPSSKADSTIVATTLEPPLDLISPKTVREQSVGFHAVLGVDGDLETSDHMISSKNGNDDYEAITMSILQDHGAQCSTASVQLCLSFGGKVKVLEQTDKPLEILRHYEELELDPRLFVRRIHDAVS